jgi:hypothetical protein
LRSDDFPAVAESALAGATVTVDARLDTRVSAAMMIYDPRWKPVQFDGTHLVVTAPTALAGKELIVVHDSAAPPTAWPIGRAVRFGISDYYFTHPDVTVFEGAVIALRPLP